ncbi:alpha/beta fold hydrolase [Rhodoferax aquaticus]|uniref:Alpha/beta hydrolase n=1 Tax=Rhodoferax aquaticus TaxID=2527691 RepID=A0A515ER98_9BURK|nr:alpha/beta hydrolase [Rhodoferax aquaticus]QDL55196.1 alpha/beta hydrolase [Rhodoferax aquaticus]
MNLTVNGHSTYCYTGGKPFDAAKPTMVFVHGVLHDHSVWALQSRYFAHHGWNVLALDLPGHCKSAGPAPTSVEEAADFVMAVLDAVGLQQATLIGHSWGSLIALETAARAPQRIKQLVLIGTAFPMKVAPALLESSLNTPMQALEMVNVFSRSTLCAPPSVLGPGTWVYGASMALGRRVLASNRQVNVFHAGFSACNNYAGGLEAISKVTCPVLYVLGETDQMTPPKAAQGLIAKTALAEVAMLPGGHHQMSETPEHLLKALVQFLQP